MKIGLWNIDHAEYGTGSKRKQERYQFIVDYLISRNCHSYVITEANSAITLPGFNAQFSEESPFLRKSRFYGPPNCYHQVALYSKETTRKCSIQEPINGLLCQFPASPLVEYLYGNAVTIKDRWSPVSTKKYTDRLKEQIAQIKLLDVKKTVIAGDFNLRINWPATKSAHQSIQVELAETGWVWPTREQTDSVQHVLHSPDITSTIEMDHNVANRSPWDMPLSDHPFIEISLSANAVTNV
ncbi:MAG: hypothetical protein GKR95_02390 [Gammaproteobacteria bacterium]|nr:hypothetical protein [Gammaproteobacteria bacterium]